jgi:hypothetical protein
MQAKWSGKERKITIKQIKTLPKLSLTIRDSFFVDKKKKRWYHYHIT